MKPTLRTLLLLAFASAPLLQADQPPALVQDKAQPKEQTDQEKLAGAWRVTSGESAGTKFGAADLGDMKVTFKGNRVRWEQKDSDAVESTYLLAPAKKPKQIDLGGKA